MIKHPAAPQTSWIGPALTGLVLGALTGLSPLLEREVLSPLAIRTLGLGLATTYFSVGLLIGILPNFPGWDRSRLGGVAFGVLIGALYSVPGAIFTMVPYPLAPDAPEYFREFVSGGGRAFVLTLGFGGVVGGFAGFFRRKFGSP